MLLVLYFFVLILQIARSLLCSESSSLTPCTFSNLQDIETLTSCCSANFNFSSESITLTQSLNFSGFDYVKFEGLSTVTTVECANQVGIKFEQVSQVVIVAMQFLNCSSWHDYTSSNNEILWIQFAVVIISSNVVVRRSIFAHSQGVGLALLNNKKVVIEDSSFINNTGDLEFKSGNASFIGGGGGLYIELSCCSNLDKCNNSTNFNYVISSSNFTGNKAMFQRSLKLKEPFYGLGNGGGMEVWLCNSALSNISISGCHYEENNATWGGGMQIVLSDGSHNNVVSIRDSTFRSNLAGQGAGGLDMGYVGSYVKENKILLNNVTFEDNRASFGAGCAIFTDLEYQQTSNSIKVEECTWTENVAHYGSAVTISPYRTDVPSMDQKLRFTNCHFVSNRVIEKQVSEMLHKRAKEFSWLLAMSSLLWETFLLKTTTPLASMQSLVF